MIHHSNRLLSVLRRVPHSALSSCSLSKYGDFSNLLSSRNLRLGFFVWSSVLEYHNKLCLFYLLKEWISILRWYPKKGHTREKRWRSNFDRKSVFWIAKSKSWRVKTECRNTSISTWIPYQLHSFRIQSKIWAFEKWRITVGCYRENSRTHSFYAQSQRKVVFLRFTKQWSKNSSQGVPTEEHQ